jgi:DNA-binding NarL/FixJ family response regulator
MQVVAECTDAADAAAAAARERPDVCLIDTELPGGSAPAVDAIRALYPQTRVVMLSSAVHAGHFFEAVRHGTAGYVLKGADPGRLADDVAAVAHGNAALSPEFAVHLLEAFQSRRRATGLTPREAEVLALLGDGLSTKETALRLGVSTTTVRRHVSSAVKRLGAANRSDAIARITSSTEHDQGGIS